MEASFMGQAVLLLSFVGYSMLFLAQLIESLT